MSDELSEEMLFILNIFYKNRNLSSDKGYHSQKLKNLYGKKFPGREYLTLKDAIKKLHNEGYITTIKKKEVKYYISNIPMAVLALQEHGFIKGFH
ncbi:hypothetical protein L0665_03905 [Methanogenium marinum]|uniref:Uncharacterized protein n=1 Tax=Methanogenium marinum TaxID=348610 RepID=A0A9Q4KSI1_9EURY|nr:hypothetical protein [Methanogenium marinum]MDE4907756.1 hypothetical protein [Methanogenium marinum]